MSWPLGTAALADAVRTRPEPVVWLGVYHSDRVKEWSRREARSGFLASYCTVRIGYSEADVRRRVDSEKRMYHSCKKADWFGMDDPPLVNSSVYSVPAAVMKSAGLTRVVVGQTLITVLQGFPRGSITAHDWDVELVLNANDQCLRARTFVRPVREWELVSEHVVQLAEAA